MRKTKPKGAKKRPARSLESFVGGAQKGGTGIMGKKKGEI